MNDLYTRMSLTPAEIQQALRISKAIQEHLENTRAVNVPSTELYGMLADRKLVERDIEKGHHFRLFLRKLVKANMLNLIPQCKALPRSAGRHDWIFNSAADRMPARRPGEAPAAAAASSEAPAKEPKEVSVDQ